MQVVVQQVEDWTSIEVPFDVGSTSGTGCGWQGYRCKRGGGGGGGAPRGERLQTVCTSLAVYCSETKLKPGAGRDA